MRIAIATERRDHATTRARSDRAARVLLVGDGPVVDALEHPQHVHRRKDHAGRGERRRQRGFQLNAPSRIRNSPTNPFRPGRPIDASVRAGTRPPASASTVFSPPNSAISRVCRRSDSMPTIRKRPPVLMPCASIWYTAPCTPCTFIAHMPEHDEAQMADATSRPPASSCRAAPSRRARRRRCR